MDSSAYQLQELNAGAVATQRTFVMRVYYWMAIGLLLTAIAAVLTMSSVELLLAIVSNKPLFYGLLLGELALVWGLSAAIDRLSPLVASLGFVIYAILNGVTLSVLTLVYTQSSIAGTFFVTAGTFGAMSVYGYFTQRDLTSFGNLLLMALIGLVLASLVNIFLANSTLYWLLTYAGIAIFVGLTAYDTQKIKRLSLVTVEGTDEDRKAAVLGALVLYLDFINLFLMLLRVLGRRK